ncbi:MAG: kinase/pyrophosphorylase, partial [Deltaproteobacteria bacterium]|nr:kinase/pyrophosphorylase [Deltaproteobacteria bacterium]
SSDDLATYRSTRLKKMGRPESEQYAQKEHIEKELAYANDVFQKLGVPLVINIGGKATEEVASEIILAMGI